VYRVRDDIQSVENRMDRKEKELQKKKSYRERRELLRATALRLSAATVRFTWKRCRN
jgi:hypothetical protein